ncbi:hypothetical protein A0U40_01290 [[Bacillus] sp. KCTC 13219]|nr:hypothetical protein A0U40_01290 [[Bacillus] sp. KCTC 13219]
MTVQIILIKIKSRITATDFDLLYIHFLKLKAQIPLESFAPLKMMANQPSILLLPLGIKLFKKDGCHV